MNNVSVIGVGRIGLCFCLSLERAGYNVVGCDINQDYVDAINNKTFVSHEPGVNERLAVSERFLATTDISKAVDHARVIFVLVRTTSEPDGRYNVSQVESVVNSLIKMGTQEKEKHFVLSSNVNPGYSDWVAAALRPHNWVVTYNPEMIAQGTFMKNQAYPDCIYIGTDDEEPANEIEEIYNNMCLNEPKIFKNSRLETELTKVSLNCLLTVKISYANMVGDLAVKMGADPHKVLSAVAGDGRTNPKYLGYGYGFGGPCFPRDTRAFIRCCELNKVSADMCRAANSINSKHLDFQVQDYMNKNDKNKEVQLDGVTYKKGVTSIEESQQLIYAVRLAENGYSVTINETKPVVEEIKKTYGNLFKYTIRQ